MVGALSGEAKMTEAEPCSLENRGHEITPFFGIKQCKCMILVKDFPYNREFFGLVI